MLFGVGHGTGKKRLGDSLPAVLRGNDEADDRPDGLIVDGLHDRRARQPRILFSRSNRNPTDGHFVPIANESRRPPGFHEFFQLSSVCFSPCGARWWRCLGAAQPIGHAPATSSDRATSRFEDRLKVGPALWRKGQNGELHAIFNPPSSGANWESSIMVQEPWILPTSHPILRRFESFSRAFPESRLTCARAALCA